MKPANRKVSETTLNRPKEDTVFKKLLPVVLAIFVFLTACGPKSAPVDTTPTQAATAAPTPAPTLQPAKNLAPRHQQWSSMGFGKQGWTVEIIAEESQGCVMDLKQDPKACESPITIRPKNDLVIIKDNRFYKTLLKGEITTIDFDSGVFDFYAFEYGDSPFATGWQESAFLFDVVTPVLLTVSTADRTEFINLMDGQAFLMDQGVQYFQMYAAIPASEYPVYGYLSCGYTSDYVLYCAFLLP